MLIMIRRGLAVAVGIGILAAGCDRLFPFRTRTPDGAEAEAGAPAPEAGGPRDAASSEVPVELSLDQIRPGDLTPPHRPAPDWSKALCGSNFVSAVGLAAAPTTGDFYVCGAFLDLTFDGASYSAQGLSEGKQDGFVASLKIAGGAMSWLEPLIAEADPSVADTAAAAAVAPPQIWTVGYADTQPKSSAAVVARAADGSVKVPAVVAPGASALAALVDSAANLYVGGSFSGTVNFGTTTDTARTALGQQDAFVASFSPGGTLRWFSRLAEGASPTATAEVRGLALQSDGASTVISAVGNFDGALQLSSTMSPFVSQQADILIARLDPSTGKVSGGAQLGGAGIDSAAAVAASGKRLCLAGSVGAPTSIGPYAVGSTTAVLSFLVACFDGTSPVLAKSFGGGGLSWGTSIALDSDLDVYVAGAYTAAFAMPDGAQVSIGGTMDGLLISLSPGGTLRWWSRLGGPKMDWASAVVALGRDDLLVAGNFTDQIDLGGPILNCAATNLAGYLLRLLPSKP